MTKSAGYFTPLSLRKGILRNPFGMEICSGIHLPVRWIM